VVCEDLEGQEMTSPVRLATPRVAVSHGAAPDGREAQPLVQASNPPALLQAVITVEDDANADPTATHFLREATADFDLSSQQQEEQTGVRLNLLQDIQYGDETNPAPHCEQPMVELPIIVNPMVVQIEAGQAAGPSQQTTRNGRIR
jgi:hypothetical protein